MLEHNTRNSNGQPWVTSIIYQSTVDPEGFYIAFEDLPMSTADWKVTGVPGNMGTNDGDFNDFVFYISGIGCQGGGMPCDTGLENGALRTRKAEVVAGQSLARRFILLLDLWVPRDAYLNFSMIRK